MQVSFVVLGHFDGGHRWKLRLQEREQARHFLCQCIRVARAQADPIGAGLQDALVFSRQVDAVRVAIQRGAGINAERDLGGMILGRPNGQ
ncbi:hypothetical protein D3C80_2017130 [compost metagenome]